MNSKAFHIKRPQDTKAFLIFHNSLPREIVNSLNPKVRALDEIHGS